MEVASSDEEDEEPGSPEGVEHAPDDIQVQVCDSPMIKRTILNPKYSFCVFLEKN
jgi:hypothetical protein